MFSDNYSEKVWSVYGLSLDSWHIKKWKHSLDIALKKYALECNSILGCVNKNIPNCLREAIMPCSALVRPCRFWVLQYKNDTSELKWVQQKVSCGLWAGAPFLGDQTEAMGLVQAGEKAVLRGPKLFACTNKKIDNISNAWWDNETKDRNRNEKFPLDIKKKMRTVRYWNTFSEWLCGLYNWRFSRPDWLKLWAG